MELRLRCAGIKYNPFCYSVLTFRDYFLDVVFRFFCIFVFDRLRHPRFRAIAADRVLAFNVFRISAIATSTNFNNTTILKFADERLL